MDCFGVLFHAINYGDLSLRSWWRGEDAQRAIYNRMRENFILCHQLGGSFPFTDYMEGYAFCVEMIVPLPALECAFPLLCPS